MEDGWEYVCTECEKCGGNGCCTPYKTDTYHCAEGRAKGIKAIWTKRRTSQSEGEIDG